MKINNVKTCAKIKTQANYNHLQRTMIAPICPIPMHLHLNHEQSVVCHHILIMLLLFLSSTLHKAYKACKVEEKDIPSTTYFSKTFNHINIESFFRNIYFTSLFVHSLYHPLQYSSTTHLASLMKIVSFISFGLMRTSTQFKIIEHHHLHKQNDKTIRRPKCVFSD